MIEVVLASSNPHKLDEIYSISQSSNIDFTLVGAGFDPFESGQTFEENAYIKALEATKITGKIALADDSGLCVEALNGAPGIHSARYAPSQKEKIDKLLDALKLESNKRAKFVCSMVLTGLDGEILHKTQGVVEGVIEDEPRGSNGFGYDPVFFVPEINKTMAQMSANEKNTLSHRARALLPMLEWIEQNLVK